MKKRKVIGWVLFGWGGIGLVMNLATWLPYVVEDSVGLTYAIINLIACTVFMIGGWKLKQSAKVKA